jgi:hypothetical protein
LRREYELDEGAGNNRKRLGFLLFCARAGELLCLCKKSGMLGLLSPGIPDNHYLLDIDEAGYLIFFKMKHISLNLGHFAADRSAFTNNLNLFAQLSF